MATFRDVLGIQLQIEGAQTSAQFDRVLDRLGQAASSFKTDMAKAIVSSGSDIEKTFQSSLGKAVAAGFDAASVASLQKKFYESAKPITDAMTKAKLLEQELATASSQSQKDLIKAQLSGLQQIQAQYKQDIENRSKLELSRLTMAHDQETKLREAVFKHEESKLEELANKRAKLFQDYVSNSSKSFEEKFEGTTKGLGEFFGSAMQLNLEGVLKSFGSGMAKIGSGQRGKAAGEGGDSKIGKVLETLGKSIGMIGMVVGGLAMLVKTLIDADTVVKQMNQEILKSASAMDVMGQRGGDLTGRLKQLRDVATKTASALPIVGSGLKEVLNFGITSKDYLEMIGKFQETGVTLDQMTKSAKSAEEEADQYTKYVKAATVASRALGEEFGTTAQNMGEYMKDLGLSIDEVQNAFALVAKEGASAGFGTKRFFNMVLQATSGITMYNVRLGSTAKLLTQLSRVLGGKAAGQMLQNLTQSIGGESYQDRYKRIMTTGQGVTKMVIGKEAERQASTMGAAARGANIQTTGMSEGAAAVAAKLGKTSDEEMVKMMAKISEKDRASLLAGLRTTDEDLARRMEAFIDVAKGTRGDIASQAKALEGLGPGGKLVMELNRMQAVIGKPLDKMNMFEKMAYQQQTGMSSEMIAQMERVQRAVTGDFDMAKKLAADVKANPAKLDEANKLLEKTGMAVTASGEVVSQQTGKAIKDTNDALINYEETADKEEEEALTMQEKLSKEVSHNTYELTQILSESITQILNWIGGLVQDILVFLGLKDDPAAMKEALGAAMKKHDEEAKDVDKQMKDLDEMAKALKEQGKSATGAEKAQVQDALDAIVKQQETLKTRREEIRAESRETATFAGSAGEKQLELFNKLISEGGMEKGKALSYTRGLSEQDAAAKVAEVEKGTSTWEALGKIGESTAQGATAGLVGGAAIGSLAGGVGAAPGGVAGAIAGGVGGATSGAIGAFSGPSESDLYKNLAIQADKTQDIAKDGSKTTTNTKDTAKNTDEIKKKAQEQIDLLKQAQTDREADALRKQLLGAGITEEQLSASGFASAGMSEQQIKEALFGLSQGSDVAVPYSKFLGGLRGDLGKKYKVQDAYISPDGTVVEFSPGDAIYALNEAAAAGKGGAGGAGGATVNIIINGANGNVQQQVVSALKQFYTTVTGVA